MERKISDRLCSNQGIAELRRTSFFSSYDFDRLTQKGYDPEFRPPTSGHATDVRNFDTEFTAEQPVDSMVNDQMSETMQEKSNFQGFTFKEE